MERGRRAVVVGTAAMLCMLAGCTDHERETLQTEVASAGIAAEATEPPAAGPEVTDPASGAYNARGASSALVGGSDEPADEGLARSRAAHELDGAYPSAMVDLLESGGRDRHARRVLVLLQGLYSSNDPETSTRGTEVCTWQDLRRVLRTKDEGGFYDDIIAFSYAGYGKAYSPQDTFRPIDESVDVLEHTIAAYVSLTGHEASCFDLLGHSLGGVIAWQLAARWGLDPERAPLLYHVAAVHSPVNGSALLDRYANGKGQLDNQVWRSFRSTWPQGAASEAVEELADWADHRREKTAQNIAVAQELAENGVLARTFASDSDSVVSVADSLIPGFGWHADLGTGGLLSPCGASSTPELDLGHFLGHGTILHSDAALQAISAFLQ